MDRFWKIIDKFQGVMKFIGAFCLVGMTFLTCADVIGRFFRHPIFGAVEIVGFMATLAVAMALPYTHSERSHIGVEILVRVLPRRAQIIIDLCTAILSFFLFLLITWRMFVYGNTMKRSGEVSMNLELPEYIIIYVVGVCFLIFTIIIIKDIKECIKGLKKR